MVSAADIDGVHPFLVSHRVDDERQMHHRVRTKLNNMFTKLRTCNVTQFEAIRCVRFRRDDIQSEYLGIPPTISNGADNGSTVKPGTAGNQNALRSHGRIGSQDAELQKTTTGPEDAVPHPDMREGYRFVRNSGVANGKLSYTIALPVRTAYDVRFAGQVKVALASGESEPA